MPILFRSLRAKHKKYGASKELIRLPGTDWSHLREYTSTDDSRDIIWKKSTETNRIYSRERQDAGSFSILIVVDKIVGDGFYYDNFPVSRESFYDEGIRLIEKSAREGGHACQVFQSIDELVKTKPQQALVFILSGTLDRGAIKTLGTVAPHNDLIFLHTLHPMELSGVSDILFDGKSVQASPYQKEFEKKTKNIQEFIAHIRGTYLKIETREDIEKRLNYFFKTRFQHG